MDVNVGHLMDSWDLPGTAHFAEHMLFLGTAKYPEENEYSKFITSNAGMSNAFTASNHTNYHFDVKPDQLQGALDRFVQFFLTPQFTESATEREVCAVDSEHSNNLKNDGWRNMQVDRHMSKPGHDYGKFGTGNKKTLMEDARTKGIEPREALLEFHKQWYSSNIMCLCVVGKESLDELENLVTSLDFGAIENKSVERKQWLDHPYQGESLGKRIEVVFSFKITQTGFSETHLIGHEAKGSLLSELKRRGWVSSLSSGHHSPASGFGVFEIKDKQTPLTLAQTAAEELQYIPMNDILSSRYLIEEFKSDRITELLNMLTPQNFYYRVVAQKFAGQEGNTHEPVYSTEMNISKIEDSSIKKFQEAMENGHPSFHLPEKNTFIATKFDLKPREEKNSPIPELLCDTDYLRLWFLQDDEYKLPKAVTKISITTPMVAHDPKTTLLSNLWIWCFTDDLAEDTYNAELAGLRQSISMNRFGTFIKVNGYDEKMPEFTKFLANRMTNYKIDRVRFDVLFEMLKRALRNHAHNQPYNLSQHYLHLLIDEKYWSKEQLLAVCEGITPEEVEKFGNEMFKAFHMEMLVHGNVTKESSNYKRPQIGQSFISAFSET
ncbi:hypothetical protein WR25_18299 [Diploscapter pachys]|uniref:Peptidase M16 N-terminal domain-containing protein n=1 Tax=Diploscapter pachys TaxID=2018661 RepID=A0A2A2L9N8_9BILA|nr:hypothetical protein WR25_18299 [Diploscapter pachys]